MLGHGHYLIGIAKLSAAEVGPVYCTGILLQRMWLSVFLDLMLLGVPPNFYLPQRGRGEQEIQVQGQRRNPLVGW